MNKNYQRGVRFERQIIALLESEGYNTLRTAGSHGFADVVATNSLLVRFVQGKVSKADKISLATYKNDVKKIKETSVPDCVSKELWIKIDRKPIYKILIL